MQFKVTPQDFVVEECLQLPAGSAGGFTVYRVRKQDVTTLRVQAQMARKLNVPQSAVVFPALKDKAAVTVQHASVRGSGPDRLANRGFTAQRLGTSARPLTPADITANRFTLVLRDLALEEGTHIDARLAQVTQEGLPNYFDQQRFGSLSPGNEPIGKLILRRDAEGALRAYLAHPFLGDPAPVKRFKKVARAQWGDWQALFEAAPRPSNLRSVLTYLRDHPTGYRKALNLITRRLLSIYLAAYQSLLWNRIAGRFLAAQLDPPAHVEIAGEQFPLYHRRPSHLDPALVIPLPSHRAVYADAGLAAIVDRVLEEEELALNDLKARILKRAYLNKGKRALFLVPQDTSAALPEPDDLFPGRHKMTVAFALPRGSYATLVLKALTA